MCAYLRIFPLMVLCCSAVASADMDREFGDRYYQMRQIDRFVLNLWRSHRVFHVCRFTGRKSERELDRSAVEKDRGTGDLVVKGVFNLYSLDSDETRFVRTVDVHHAVEGADLFNPMGFGEDSHDQRIPVIWHRVCD